jgi:hypothetical protein
LTIVVREIQLRVAAKAWLEQASRRLAESWPFRTIGPCSTVAFRPKRSSSLFLPDLILGDNALVETRAACTSDWLTRGLLSESDGRSGTDEADTLGPGSTVRYRVGLSDDWRYESTVVLD